MLICFLNAVLGFEGDARIKQVRLVNPYQLPEIEELKETILDVKATNERGESFIVEMQKQAHQNFHQRSLYYTAKSYVSQLPKGSAYHTLKKVYFVGILNFKFFDNQNYVSQHLILNKETLSHEIKDFEFCILGVAKIQHGAIRASNDVR